MDEADAPEGVFDETEEADLEPPGEEAPWELGDHFAGPLRELLEVGSSRLVGEEQAKRGGVGVAGVEEAPEEKALVPEGREGLHQDQGEDPA